MDESLTVICDIYLSGTSPLVFLSVGRKTTRSQMRSTRSSLRSAAAVSLSLASTPHSLSVKLKMDEEEDEEEESSLNDESLSQQWKVKIDYSLDQPTTLVRGEPLLKIVTLEDRPTKEFYRNPSASVPERTVKKSILKSQSSGRLSSFSPSPHPRSLLQPTLNVFTPSPTTRRRSRLEIYIKPYRGEPNRPSSQERRRRRERTSPSPVKKARVSWSPVREVIPPLRDSSHAETMEHYERLLQRMRRTDEELLSLSTRLKTKGPVLKVVKKATFFSPAVLQLCLLLLLLCNLLLAYFFNELNTWWSDSLHSSDTFT